MAIGILLSNLAVFRANAIICVSDELRRALWWRRSRAVVIPDGVDLDRFSPGSQEDARKTLGWNAVDPVVIFNGKRDPKNKGEDLAKAAMDHVWSAMPNVKLNIVRNVDFALMPLYYRAADVLLCTSRQEGSPNVVKEALACNLPVVSVPVGDVPQRLRGVAPSAVVPRNPHALARALKDILSSRRRSNGRELVAHLSLQEIATQVATVYQSVTEAQRLSSVPIQM